MANPTSTDRNSDEKMQSTPGGNGDVELQSSTSTPDNGMAPVNRTTTQRGLKSRHAQMMALGGTIGTGLFVGSGQGLNMGGPLSLLLSYIIISLLLYGVATATGEMASYLPVPGSSMSYFGHRFGSKSLGFTLGWIYWYIFAITVPAEIVVTNLVIQYWSPPLHAAVWLTIVGAIIIGLNCVPIRYYGEAEFWFASIKVIGIIGLLILSTILFFGGGPSREPLWFSNWSKPAPVKEYIFQGDVGRLVGFMSTITFSVFAFAFAPELLVITGGEMQSPRQNLPKATRRYFYRLIIFYLLGALGIGIICAGNNPDLLGGGSGAAVSPWALGAKAAGIKALDSIINAVIVLSAWSAGAAYLYMSSRALYSMALAGNAPRIFTRCTQSGIPHWALAASASFSVLSYLTLAATGAQVFNWFINIINTGGFQSWICCCILYIRFRKATTAQGITDLPMRSRLQPYTAWVSLVGFTLLLLLNGFKVFLAGHWDAATFLSAYIGIPIFLAIYLGHKFTVGREDAWFRDPLEVDMHSGLDELALAEVPTKPPYKWYQKWRVLIE
ncbi:Putative proline-specific permease put4 [Tolypocladium paradoxum]|uniref:Proline-specific permease put4 n=1 Tax=Tolypocladium paradoxum TaxID=94208 RepID=A0A2S4KUQ6_9HYPO|nr:Putative proline-specific permease put4 [Tolypocladium paradoxum]